MTQCAFSHAYRKCLFVDIQLWSCCYFTTVILSLKIQVVDQKKLQKAEAKIKAKQEKRAQDGEPINEIRGR